MYFSTFPAMTANVNFGLSFSVMRAVYQIPAPVSNENRRPRLRRRRLETQTQSSKNQVVAVWKSFIALVTALE
jgi:hypothetical protein